MRNLFLLLIVGTIIVGRPDCHCGSGGYFTGRTMVSDFKWVKVYRCYFKGHYYDVDARTKYVKKKKPDMDFGPYQ